MTIKTGISDGMATEIVEGLKEGDRVVTGVTESGGAAPTPATNPFGGGPRRRLNREFSLMVDSSAPVAVRLEDVQKTYRTGEVDVHAVRGVSMEIARGEFVALMGSSGSGKSTLMNILGCLDRPTSGRYFLDGEDVSSLSRDRAG